MIADRLEIRIVRLETWQGNWWMCEGEEKLEAGSLFSHLNIGQWVSRFLTPNHHLLFSQIISNQVISLLCFLTIN